MTWYLKPEEILELHYKVIQDYGGSHGVRDENRLLSVCAAPQQSAFGQEQYLTVFEKAAVYLRNIIGDHPFVDGNKRTAVTVTVIFLKRNGLKFKASPSDLEDYAVAVATKHPSITEIAEWLQQHSAKA